MGDKMVTYYADFETANLTKVVTVASGLCRLDVTVGAGKLFKKDDQCFVRYDLYIRNVGSIETTLRVKAAAWVGGELITTASTSCAGIDPGAVRTDYFAFAMNVLPEQIMGQLQAEVAASGVMMPIKK